MRRLGVQKRSVVTGLIVLSLGAVACSSTENGATTAPFAGFAHPVATATELPESTVQWRRFEFDSGASGPAGRLYEFDYPAGWVVTEGETTEDSVFTPEISFVVLTGTGLEAMRIESPGVLADPPPGRPAVVWYAEQVIAAVADKATGFELIDVASITTGPSEKYLVTYRTNSTGAREYVLATFLSRLQSFELRSRLNESVPRSERLIIEEMHRSFAVKSDR